MSGPAPKVRASLALAHSDLDLPHAVIDPQASDPTLVQLDETRAIVVEGGERHRVLLLPRIQGSTAREVVVNGWRLLVDVEPERHAALRERARRGRAESAAGGPTEVRAVIPGRVLSIAVGEGDTVSAGQPLIVVEAMKMQNELRAPRDGTVQRVAVAPDRTIELGDVLLVLA